MGLLYLLIKNKVMTEEEYENWESVRYRMDHEGIEYCFENYSNWNEIKDEEFHKLRLELLDNMRKIRNYVENKLESNNEDELDSDNELCYCGNPVDTSNPDCVLHNLCKEHEMDV